MFAFCTAAMAAFEVYREVCSADFKPRGPYSVRFIFCALALVQFGPMTLPWPIHVALITLLYGVSLFTSTTLAVYLKEENRRSKAGLREPRRSIWNTHRVFISVAFAVFVGSDLILILSIMTLGAVTSPTTQVVFEVFSISVILAGLIVASSFIYQVCGSYLDPESLFPKLLILSFSCRHGNYDFRSSITCSKECPRPTLMVLEAYAA